MFLQKTKRLQSETGNLLSKIHKIGLVLKEAAYAYFKGDMESFSHFVEESNTLESEIDHIRKTIELSLYSDMLIPESRGDVFRLLESLDDVADCVEMVLREYDIEKPVFPEEIIPDMLQVADLSCRCIEKLVQAVSAYFTNTEKTSSYVQEVKFCESEIDRYEESIKRKIFSGDYVKDLAVKLQLRYFIEQTGNISDYAEEVCERLAISIVKRSI
jgi:predicted phosphate transport protein (TIGR00153 family)